VLDAWDPLDTTIWGPAEDPMKSSLLVQGSL
jgi:hypothetical protein